MSRALSAVASLRLTLARGSLLLLALLLSVPSALADRNILLNGELIEGTGNRPDHWRTESLAHDARTFSWVRKPGGPSELRITNARSDFAQWVQTVRLDPGWYFLSGEMRIEGVDPQTGSGMIGVYVNGRGFGLSQNTRMSSDWIAGGLYFKVGDPGYSVEIVCQLQGSSGTVLFRHIRLTTASEPPRSAMQVDLDSVLKARVLREKRSIPKPFEKPTGSLWTYPATMLVFAAIALSGWLILGSTKSGVPDRSDRGQNHDS